MSPYMTIFRHLLANLDPHSPFFSKTANQITKEFVNVNQHNLKFNSGVSFILKTLIFATFPKNVFSEKSFGGTHRLKNIRSVRPRIFIITASLCQNICVILDKMEVQMALASVQLSQKYFLR